MPVPWRSYDSQARYSHFEVVNLESVTNPTGRAQQASIVKWKCHVEELNAWSQWHVNFMRKVGGVCIPHFFTLSLSHWLSGTLASQSSLRCQAWFSNGSVELKTGGMHQVPLLHLLLRWDVASLLIRHTSGQCSRSARYSPW